MKRTVFKKIAGLLLLLCFITPSSWACDICGCGAGNAYIGILPEFSSKIIGVRYRANALETHLGPGGTRSYLTTQEHYHTAELWGGWTWKDKFRVMATLPVGFNSKLNAEGRSAKSGLGDAGIQAYYRLLHHKNTLGVSNAGLLVQDLWIGGGVKLPTGKYETADRDLSGKSANLFQLGTGSFDFLFTLMYDLRFQNAGLNISGNYKGNTSNKYDYTYGNKGSGSAQLYYKFRIKQSATIAPNAGLSYEHSAPDLDNGYKVFTSGGYILFGTIGTELLYKNIALGGNFQPVLSQDLANGAVMARHRLMIHVSLMF